MMKYDDEPKKQNLYYYTNLFIESLKIKTNYKCVTEALMIEIVKR